MRQEVIDALQQAISPARVLTDDADLWCFAYDASYEAQKQPHRPDIVVQPAGTADVVAAVRIAAKYAVPITPRGAATGQAGGAVPVRGGIVVDLSQLNRVIEIDGDNLQVVVEPGIIQAQLNSILAPHRLFFPPDPGSARMCSVGGMVANNARGMRCVKYGATSEYVLGLEVVLPTGECVDLGLEHKRSLQSASGFELVKYFTGSEGMLGIITRLRLKVLPQPIARGIAMAMFRRLEDVGPAIVAVFRSGILPSAVEVFDSETIRAANTFRPDLNLPDGDAMLLFEVDGNPPGVAYDLEQIGRSVGELAMRLEWSTDPAEMARMWEARSVVGASFGKLRPDGVRIYAGEDISVPITRLPTAFRRIHEIGQKYELTIACYGHTGGGIVHSGIVGNPSDPAERKRIELAADEINWLALELQGSVTGEHGVGIARIPYMEAEHGAALDVMRRIKHALDPQGILNPGKMFPDLP